MNQTRDLKKGTLDVIQPPKVGYFVSAGLAAGGISHKGMKTAEVNMQNRRKYTKAFQINSNTSGEPNADLRHPSC